MRISVKKITVKHYKFKLKNPIKLQSGQVITYREGLLLYYPINQHYHIADVAPLPGFSTETIQEVQKEITTNMPKSPSLKCGLEALKLMNQSHKKNIPLDLIIAQKLNLTTQKEKNNTPITYNGLVTLNTTQIESKIKQLYQKGIHTIKIKVGYTLMQMERDMKAQAEIMECTASFPAINAKMKSLEKKQKSLEAKVNVSEDLWKLKRELTNSERNFDRLLKDKNKLEEDLNICKETYTKELQEMNNNISLTYTYDSQGSSTGITALLQDIKSAGLKLKDLNSSQTSLETIFEKLLEESA